MSTPVIFKSENQNFGVCTKDSECCIDKNNAFIKGQEIKNINISSDTFPDDKENKNSVFTNNCGDLIISICQFKDCYTNDDFGGGLLVQQNCHVILHHTIFDTCRSKKHGAAAAIAELLTVGYYQGQDQNDMRPNDPEHKCSNKINVQYTCFQNCYPEETRGYGSAMIMGANDVTLLYASTVNCPGEGHQTWGAQFDIMAKNSIASKFVNATGGISHFCGSIEYRDANYGSFQFQTIAKMKCKYATSFTSVNINGLKISSCNVHDNTVINSDFDESENKPCMVFVRKKDILIEDFFFFDNNFGTD